MKRSAFIVALIVALLWWKPQLAALTWRFIEDMFRLIILSK